MSDLAHKIVMFIDVRDSTTLYETVGDVAAETTIRTALQSCQRSIEAGDGHVVKNLGDGLLAIFGTAESALEAAQTIQRKQKGESAHLGIGLHAGQLIERDGDVFGDVVNVASRLCSLARPNEILVSNTLVDDGAAGQIPHEAMESFTVKGRKEPVSVFRINWDFQADKTVFLSSGGSGNAPSTLMIITPAKAYMVSAETPLLAIGRTEGDIIMPAPLVSRQHAVIHATVGRFILTDRSTNGTIIHYDTGQKVVLRREATDLVGSGSIGFGAAPGAPETTVKFRSM